MSAGWNARVDLLSVLRLVERLSCVVRDSERMRNPTFCATPIKVCATDVLVFYTTQTAPTKEIHSNAVFKILPYCCKRHGQTNCASQAQYRALIIRTCLFFVGLGVGGGGSILCISICLCIHIYICIYIKKGILEEYLTPVVGSRVLAPQGFGPSLWPRAGRRLDLQVSS